MSCEKPQISCPYIYGFDILSIVTSCDSFCHRLGAQFFFDYSFGFRNRREFFYPFFVFLPSAVVLCFALSICICIINPFSLLFSVGKQEREKERCEVLKKGCWEIWKKGVCSICLIICCCWVSSEAAASFSRSKTCATHNESDGFDGRWRRVSSFSSIAIWNSERRKA